MVDAKTLAELLELKLEAKMRALKTPISQLAPIGQVRLSDAEKLARYQELTTEQRLALRDLWGEETWARYTAEMQRIANAGA